MDSSTQLAFDFVQDFNRVILFPTIGLLSAVALLVFMYGCFLYIARSNDAAARTQGVKHITWGIVGLVVMLSAYTIMSIFAGTVGLGDALDCADDPFSSGCDGVVVPIPTGNTGTGGNSGSGNTGTGGNSGSGNTGTGS